jgi:hypothetical protein
VLGIRRRAARSRAQLTRKELNESFEHLLQAATLMAGGVGATVGPRMNAARDFVSPASGKMRDTATHRWEATVAALAPLAAAARDGAREAGRTARRAQAKNIKILGTKESRMSRNRWPMLAGLLAAGAVVGAAGALVMRRRKQQQWEEYGPDRTLESAAEATKGAVDRAADSVSSGAGTAAGKVSSAAETAADKTASAIDTATNKASSTAQQSDELVGRTGSQSADNRF